MHWQILEVTRKEGHDIARCLVKVINGGGFQESKLEYPLEQFLKNNEDLGIYIVGGSPLTASASQKYDSYIMFLDDYQNNNSDRENTATVTFDNNIAAVIYGKNTGYKTVGTNGGMSFNAGATYPSSADKDRGYELKKASHPHESTYNPSNLETGHDWFHINNKKIIAGAKMENPETS